MKRFHAARRVCTATSVITLLLATLFTGPAFAMQEPAPTPTPAEADSETDDAATVLEVSPELSLALSVVDGPVRNDDDDTYSVTYELVITQSGEGASELEPLSLLGFAATSEVITNEDTLEEEADLASEDAATTSATESPVPAPTSTATPTPIPEIRVESGLGVAKRVVGDPTVVDGAFEFTYEISIQNVGGDAIEKLSLVDDLAEVFGADAQIEVLAATADGQMSVSDTYDGVGDVELLAPGASLASGKTGRVSVSVAVLPAELGVYEMNAAVSGSSTSGVSLMDTSTDGRIVDPDDDGDPGNDDEPTPVSLAYEQSLEIDLRVLESAAELSEGVFKGTLVVTITNPGPFDVENLQVVEAFADSAESRVALESATSDTLTVNPFFDGRTDTALLSGIDSLKVGASGVVALDLVTSFADLQDVAQLASAEATDPFGMTVKAGAEKILAAGPSDSTRPDANTDANETTGRTTSSMSAAEATTKNQSVAGPRSAAVDAEAEREATEAVQPADRRVPGSSEVEAGSEFEVSAAPLEPAPVSGALRLQYQVAIAGLIAVVVALVGGGTAASINRRERKRAGQVSDWFQAR